MSEAKPVDFEQSLGRLEQLVAAMEGGELSLEEMIRHFEEGSKLVEVCTRTLDDVEQKIEKLVKKEGKLAMVPFDAEDAEP